MGDRFNYIQRCAYYYIPFVYLSYYSKIPCKKISISMFKLIEWIDFNEYILIILYLVEENKFNNTWSYTEL